jgi:predicted lipoprotein with Yx(FWY)xxD motif
MTTNCVRRWPPLQKPDRSHAKGEFILQTPLTAQIVDGPVGLPHDGYPAGTLLIRNQPGGKRWIGVKEDTFSEVDISFRQEG